MYPEGVFYKAYERSTWLSCMHLGNLMVKKKHIKKVNQHIVSVGFPKTALEKWANGRKTDIINDPKVREIFAADFRDRIVHHLYYNYTHELYERSFIADSYSCIKGCGIHYGIKRLQHHIRSVSRNYTLSAYVLKMDIKGYFMNIDRSILLSICHKTLERMKRQSLDFPFIHYLSEVIIMNDPVEGCHRKGKISDWDNLPDSKSLFHSPKGRGLPIGNLTSQLFSNVYMNEFDQFMKRSMKCRHYGRYVDDSFVVCQHKKELREISKKATEFLRQQLKLEVHPDKTIICNIRNGVSFLGAYMKPHRNYIHRKTLKTSETNSEIWTHVTFPLQYIHLLTHI